MASLFAAHVTPSLIRDLFDRRLAAARQLEDDAGAGEHLRFAASTTRVTLENLRTDFEKVMLGE